MKKDLYMIVHGKYPNIGSIVNVGRFYSWQAASEFMIKNNMSHDLFTIINGYGIPF